MHLLMVFLVFILIFLKNTMLLIKIIILKTFILEIKLLFVFIKFRILRLIFMTGKTYSPYAIRIILGLLIIKELQYVILLILLAIIIFILRISLRMNNILFIIELLILKIFLV